MFRFLHAADLHLDSPLRGLEAYEGAPVDQIRGATRRALENLVDLAVQERVEFVLLAGDIYDGDWPDHNTGLFFVGQMLRLREAGIPVVVIRGNHDAANRITKSLRLPDNVTVLGHDAPESVECPKIRELGVAVHGMSYATAEEDRNLALGYPPAEVGMFNIGVLHTGLAGAEGHQPYAPCSLEDLRAHHYDYWALGHIHKREIVCRDPWVVFSGNTQGRHVRETGAKGCYLVTVTGDQEVRAEFHALDVFRWEICRVDVSNAPDVDTMIEQIGGAIQNRVESHGGMALAVRIEVEGETPLHEAIHADLDRWKNDIRVAAMETAGDRVWIEKVKLATRPPGEAHRGLEGPLEELAAVFQELRSDDRDLPELVAGLSDLERKLRVGHLGRDGELRLHDAEWLRDVLQEVEPMLLARLRQEG